MSGCTARVVPISARAKVRATSRLPTPGGPWNRYACAGPSRSAASSSRPASACSEKRTSVLTDLLRDIVGCPAAVDGDDALGLGLGEGPVSPIDPLHEIDSSPLDPVVV